MGSYRTLFDANRSAVRAMGAAHQCPASGPVRVLPCRTEGQEPLTLEPPG